MRRAAPGRHPGAAPFSPTHRRRDGGSDDWAERSRPGRPSADAAGSPAEQRECPQERLDRVTPREHASRRVSDGARPPATGGPTIGPRDRRPAARRRGLRVHEQGHHDRGTLDRPCRHRRAPPPARGTTVATTWSPDGHLADTRRMPRLPVLTATATPSTATSRRSPPTAPPSPRCCWCPRSGHRTSRSTCAAARAWSRTCSRQGREIYIVTYDATGRAADRRGLELWVDEILPAALYAVSDAARRAPPCTSPGWSLGGLFTLLSAASGTSGAPIRSVTAFAVPVDVVRGAPGRARSGRSPSTPAARIFSAAYRTLGSFPATAVKCGVPAHQRRALPHQAGHAADPPRRPRAARADRGRRPAHEQHDRLPGPGVRADLPPRDPVQRPRARRPAPRRPAGPARRRPGAGPADRRRRRRHRPGRRRRARHRRC